MDETQAVQQIRPQPGPQELFLSSPADIAVYGGAAGGGKTYALLMEAVRNTANSGFGAVLFRRTMKQVKDEGGIWDQAATFYPLLGASPNQSGSYWTFPAGSVVQFAGLENEVSKYDFQGSQICLLGFDELTHFTESQFFYLLSRNRSTCGVRPYVRATTNPGPGWVKRLLAPWVDKAFPNPARSGEIRYFMRDGNQLIWLDGAPPKREPCSCLQDGCDRCFPPEKSITFVKASVFDNKILLATDPGYVSNLKALDEKDRKQLLEGDWDVKPAHRVIDAFEESRHVVPWREIPRHWKTYVGGDFGTVNTAEVVLAEDPDNNKLYLIGEDWPGHSRSFESIADTIRAMAKGTPSDGAGGSKQEEGWRQAIRKEGIPMEEPQYRDVTIQYQCVNDAFRAGDLYVFDTCVKTIAMLNNFERDLDSEGQPLDSFNDTKFHLLAALRYIVTRLRPPKQAGWAQNPEALKRLLNR